MAVTKPCPVTITKAYWGACEDFMRTIGKKPNTTFVHPVHVDAVRKHSVLGKLTQVLALPTLTPNEIRFMWSPKPIDTGEQQGNEHAHRKI